MIPDAKTILLLIRGCDDDAAEHLINQYGRAIAAKAAADTAGQAYEHVLAMFATPAERGVLQ